MACRCATVPRMVPPFLVHSFGFLIFRPSYSSPSLFLSFFLSLLFFSTYSRPSSVFFSLSFVSLPLAVSLGTSVGIHPIFFIVTTRPLVRPGRLIYDQLIWINWMSGDLLSMHALTMNISLSLSAHLIQHVCSRFVPRIFLTGAFDFVAPAKLLKRSTSRTLSSKRLRNGSRIYIIGK